MYIYIYGPLPLLPARPQVRLLPLGYARFPGSLSEFTPFGPGCSFFESWRV